MENDIIKVWLPAVRSGSGSDIFTLRLAEALERHGMDVQITWYSRGDEVFPVRMLFRSAPPNTDVIIANSWTGYAFCRNKQPLIAVVHHASFDCALDPYKSVWKRLYHKHCAEPRERRSLNTADVVITVSRYVADHVLGRYGIRNARVIHNWIDTNKFKPATRTQQERGPFRLLFVGKPTPLKGAHLLGPIMKSLGSDFELWITSSRTQCTQLGLPGNTTYLGRLDEPALIKAYQECDALLCPSYSEGFGYAALEAMACGTPVIARAGSGISELIENGINGKLCEGGIESFTTACRELAHDASAYLDFSTSARIHAVNNFSESNAIPIYVGLIESFLSGPT